MPSEPRADVRRLHPSSLVFRVLRHARGLLLPAAVVFFAARGETWQVWLAVLFVPVLALDVFRYATLQWRYDADELVVRQGWIFRSERHVPYARIQNVDLKQNVLHRALGVAEVTIETAGGAEPEAVLNVVSFAQYEELRARAFAGRAAVQPATAMEAGTAAGVATPAPAVVPVLALAPADVALLGLNPGRGLALVAIAWGALREFGIFEGWEERVEATAANPEAAAAWAGSVTALLLAGGLVLLLVLSLLGAFVEFFGFRLEEEGRVFRVRRGLFTRQVLTIPKARIQAVSVERPWFLALVGRARITVRTAGGTQPGEGGRSAGRHFAPIVRASRVPEFLARIRPDLDTTRLSWRPLAPKAPRRMLVAALLPALGFGGLAIVFFEWLGAGLAVVLVALAVVSARRRARRAAWAREGSVLCVREGAFSTAEHVTFTDKVQSVVVDESPFDRRHRHASLSVDTAGAFLRQGHDVAIRYLPRSDAFALRDELVGAAARARFRW